MQTTRCLMDPQRTDGATVGFDPAVAGPGEKPGVLVVDDEHLVRMVLQLGLERDGFEVWLASSGTEAIAVYRAHKDRIAVVLLDICMPGLDGGQTLEALRQLNPDVPACFMSGGRIGRDSNVLLDGAACVIRKPFRLSGVVQVLRQAAQGKPIDIHATQKACSD